LWIRIGFNADPDPALYLNADTDPGIQNNYDPDPGQAFKSQKSLMFKKNLLKVGNGQKTAAAYESLKDF
jgi:hypothetical protein